MKLTFRSLFTATRSRKSRSISKHESQSGSSTAGSSSSLTSDLSSSSSSPRTVLPLSVADLFNLFDRDRDGKITRYELESVLRRLGPHPVTDDELTWMVEAVDRDGDGCVSLEELAAVEDDVTATSADGEGGEEELREAFRVFDSDGDGRISAEELYGVMAALGEEGECSLEECRRMIRGVDSDGDGFVCFADFVRMMDGQIMENPISKLKH